MRLQVPVTDVISSFVQQFVDSKFAKDALEPNQGAVFTIKLSSEQLGYEKSIDVHHEDWYGRCLKHCHIIVTSRCHVFFASVQDEEGDDISDWSKIPLSAWKNTSNHSSCWSSSGFDLLNKAFYDCLDKSNENVPKESKEKVSSSFQNNRLGHGLACMEMVQFVEVNHSPIDLKKSYFRKIDSLKKLKAKLVLDTED